MHYFEINKKTTLAQFSKHSTRPNTFCIFLSWVPHRKICGLKICLYINVFTGCWIFFFTCHIHQCLFLLQRLHFFFSTEGKKYSSTWLFFKNNLFWYMFKSLRDSCFSKGLQHSRILFIVLHVVNCRYIWRVVFVFHKIPSNIDL